MCFCMKSSNVMQSVLCLNGGCFFFHVAVFCLVISSIYILCCVSKSCGCFDSFTILETGEWSAARVNI